MFFGALVVVCLEVRARASVPWRIDNNGSDYGLTTIPDFRSEKAAITMAYDSSISRATNFVGVNSAFVEFQNTYCGNPGN
jgi:hypothetical protein